MKKSILGLAVSALFVMGAAQASANPEDISATLIVSGTVAPAPSICTVNLGQPSIELNADISTIPLQGAPSALPAETVDLTITGDEQCADLVSQGKMAYTFHGDADHSMGSVLANTATGEGAAQGIGIALYGNEGQPLLINADTMTATQGAVHLGLGMVKLAGAEASAGSVKGSLTIQIERL
ncbi:fimbrial protein [Lelliottia sp. V89_10]|uniref:fimbrial protein n=1 Tax=Lelliottia wanjuensis TaxID=3050585 RepID=UPI00249DD336|nr:MULTISPECIES: fimbrial protein [unclassified Lelliottia]MDI3360358.1 fimbrial protein [Lelliottia sp. V89_13]MDK9549466.1 fimbrial protein [Lelliottia sp. V89_5]MDK9596119.1 fimbrial protein [Lelliottia sp. V89_10]